MRKFLLLLLLVCLPARAQRTVQTVNTLADMLAANPQGPQTNYFIAGTNSVNDGGQSIWTYVANSVAATNTSNTFRPTFTPLPGTAGRWLLQISLGQGGGGFSGTFTNGVTNVSGVVQGNYIAGANINLITNNGQIAIGATTGGGATNGIAQSGGFGTNTYLKNPYVTHLTNLDATPLGVFYANQNGVMTNNGAFTYGDGQGGWIIATATTNATGYEFYNFRGFMPRDESDHVYNGRFTAILSNNAVTTNRTAALLANMLVGAGTTDTSRDKVIAFYPLVEVEGTNNISEAEGIYLINAQYGYGTITNQIGIEVNNGVGNGGTGNVLTSTGIKIADWFNSGQTNRVQYNKGITIQTTTNAVVQALGIEGTGGAAWQNLGDIITLATFQTTGTILSNNTPDAWLRAVNNRNWNFYASGNVFNYWGDNAPNPIDFRLRTTNVITDLAQLSFWGGIGGTNRFGYIQPVLVSGTYPMVFDALNLSNGVFNSFRLQNGFVRIGEGSVLPQSRLEVTNGTTALALDVQKNGSSGSAARILNNGTSVTNLIVTGTGTGSPYGINVAMTGAGTLNTALGLTASGATDNIALNVLAGRSLFTPAVTFVGSITNTALSPSALVMSGTATNLQSVTLGSGLSLVGSTLSATGSGGTVTGTGTSPQVAYWSSSSGLTSSAGNTWDDSARRLTLSGSSTPGLILSNSAAGSNSKGWYANVSSSGTWFLSALNDAGSAAAVLSITRTGTTINNTTLASQFTVSGAAEITGSITNDVLTASTLAGTDANKALVSITVGSGLSLSGGTLSATGGGGSALVGTVLSNGVASVSTDLARYVDTTATNITPIHVTGSGTVPLSTGASVTNFLMKGMSGTLWTNQTQTAGTLTWANSNGVLASVTVSNGILFTNGVLIATNAGSGTVTGSGTPYEVAYWDSSGDITSDGTFWYDITSGTLHVGDANGTPGPGSAALFTRNTSGLTAAQAVVNIANAQSSTLPLGESYGLNINIQDSITGGGGKSAAIYISGTSANDVNYAFFNATSRSNQFGAGAQNYGSIGMAQGSGSPNGVLSASVGSWYFDTSGSYNTTMYVKTNGSGNTGWGAVQMTGGGGGGISGSGTSGQMTYWNGSSSVTGSSKFQFDPSGEKLTLSGSSTPYMVISNSAAASNEKSTYILQYTDGVTYFGTFNDSGTAVGNFMTFNRSGATPTSVVVPVRFVASLSSEFQDDLNVDGNLIMATVGKTVTIKSGSNAKSGTFTLSSGAATVSNTSITANSVVCTSLKSSSGTPGTAQPRIALSAGSGFTATGTATDNSTYNYVVFEVN